MTARRKPARSDARSAQTFFGFRQKPFALSPDPKFLYRSHTHAAALDTLLEALRQLDGLVVLTGDIGLGKTTLCRAIIDELHQHTVSAVIVDPRATREELLKTLLIEFGVVSVHDLKNGRLQSTSRTELSFLLREFLQSLSSSGSAAIVVFDEAQDLSPELWEEIRILSDLHSGDTPIHLLLVGQPQLSLRLKQPDMQGIDQRIAVRCHIEPLYRNEIGEFIKHRLGVARPKGSCEFDTAALDAVFTKSAGVPRVISMLCDRALHEAFKRRSKMVTRDIVEAASTKWAGSAPTLAHIAAPSQTPPPRPSTPASDFDGRVTDWLTHLEHVVEQTPKAPLETGAPRSKRDWPKPQIPLLKRLFP